jgi:protein tyrosine/serine phosphatase
LKNDSLYTNTYNNRDEFSIANIEEEFLTEEITHTKMTFDHTTANNETLLATASDSLDECISSL